MHNNGGCSSVEEILTRPVNVLASGPAAAPAGATYHTGALRKEELIVVDVVGTSFDIWLVRKGRPTVSRDVTVEGQPIGVAGVEVHSIGAGGGSVAWIDSRGALRVGPRSAGAPPGPGCYGQSGSEPTVTDANLVLGYLDPAGFLGGRRRLSEDRAAAAIRRIHRGSPWTGDDAGCRDEHLRVADATMLRGMQAISVERGLDPRRYVLVAGGGARGLHATGLARLLRVRCVLIPREASTFCASGMTVTDVRHDYVRSRHTLSTKTGAAELTSLFSSLESDARARLYFDEAGRFASITRVRPGAAVPGRVRERLGHRAIGGDHSCAEHRRYIDRRRDRKPRDRSRILGSRDGATRPHSDCDGCR
jgi:N-methylhydantoinase A